MKLLKKLFRKSYMLNDMQMKKTQRNYVLFAYFSEAVAVFYFFKIMIFGATMESFFMFMISTMISLYFHLCVPIIDISMKIEKMRKAVE